jgi:hypothetical protein
MSAYRLGAREFDPVHRPLGCARHIAAEPRDLRSRTRDIALFAQLAGEAERVTACHRAFPKP